MRRGDGRARKACGWSGGDGGDGCVAPSVETVQDGRYKPLSRPLLVYARPDTLQDRLEVTEFLTFLIENQRSLARSALFVPMTDEQASKSLTAIEGADIDAGSE